MKYEVNTFVANKMKNMHVKDGLCLVRDWKLQFSIWDKFSSSNED